MFCVFLDGMSLLECHINSGVCSWLYTSCVIYSWIFDVTWNIGIDADDIDLWQDIVLVSKLKCDFRDTVD